MLVSLSNPPLKSPIGHDPWITVTGNLRYAINFAVLGLVRGTQLELKSPTDNAVAGFSKFQSFSAAFKAICNWQAENN